MSCPYGNWKQYNQSLINRGDVTIWFSPQVLKQWSPKRDRSKLGRPPEYSDVVFRLAHTVRFLFAKTLRAAQGFIQSVIRMLGLLLKTPSYSQMSRRMSSLKLPSFAPSARGKRVILVDSTGIKLFGAGEWAAKKHREGRRGWLKIHVGVDAETQEIVAMAVTDEKTGDSRMLPTILKQVGKRVRAVIGDGAYDTSSCYEAIQKIGAKPVIPPRKGARLDRKKRSWMRLRDDYIRELRGLGGDEEAKKIWKKLQGYHERSKVETTFSRLKGILGGRLSSKTAANMSVEIWLKMAMLNELSQIGRLAA